MGAVESTVGVPQRSERLVHAGDRNVVVAVQLGGWVLVHGDVKGSETGIRPRTMRDASQLAIIAAALANHTSAHTWGL